jgi:hypothetical protein
MTSPDLGLAFTACPDDTPKRLQVWFSAPANYLRLPDCRGSGRLQLLSYDGSPRSWNNDWGMGFARRLWSVRTRFGYNYRRLKSG